MSSAEVIGVDLGGTKMLVGVLDADSRVAWESREASTGQTEKQIVDLLVREVDEARTAMPAVAAVGLGIPATIDHDRGVAISAVNLPIENLPIRDLVGLGIPATIDHDRGVAISAVNLPIENLPIRDLVGERTGLPVFVDNDANLAALAEHLFGAASGADNAVLLTIGTGIGGGLVLGGEIYRGATGAGAELGHVVIEMDGLPCQGNCPGHGCVETYASGTALGREAREAAAREPDSALGAMAAQGIGVDGKAVTEAALAGDPTSIAVFDLVGRRLGVALASFANIFEPEVIVIGGGVIAAGDLLLDPARRELHDRALPPMRDTPVRAAELGQDAGMIGAASMARIELEAAGGGG